MHDSTEHTYYIIKSTGLEAIEIGNKIAEKMDMLIIVVCWLKARKTGVVCGGCVYVL